MKMLIAIPMKDPAISKSRLSPWMKPEERRVLAARMFEGTLRFFRTAYAEYDIAVVTSSLTVWEMADSYGARVIHEGRQAGLNRAATLAASHAAQHGYARLAIVPGDVPVWLRQEVDMLFSHTGDAQAVIAESHDGGTNMLTLPPLPRFGYCYGLKSAAKFEKKLLARGLNVTRYRLPFVSCDIDTIQDCSLLGGGQYADKAEPDTTRGRDG
jgi:2-phospho-L-lactate guanylyltransferase